MAIYKQAVIQGSERAWYSLGQQYYSKQERQKAYNCFSYLAKLNNPLFLHFEEKYSGWQYTYSVACKLWAENNPLCVSLLEKVYESCPQRRKEAAHYLAKAYALKRPCFPYDREQAKRWLGNSSDLGNKDDGYLLCELDYIDYPELSLEPLIKRVRSLVDTSSIKTKYGTKPKIFLTRLLVEFGSTQGNNAALQEAFHWLLRALEETGNNSKLLIWATKDGTARSFGEIESYRHSLTTSAPDQPTRYINL